MHLKLKVSEICDVLNAQLIKQAARKTVHHISIDSRRVKKGEAFWAIRGLNQDGHKFVGQAVKNGASTIVVEKNIRVPAEVNVIKVKDTTQALGRLASYHRDKFSLPVIALTGSAGKTTTKDLIFKVLSAKYNGLKNAGSLNNHFGVPLTLLQLQDKHQAAVLELGTNQPGDIRYLTQMVKPDIAVLLNIGAAHLAGLKSASGVFREKWNIVKGVPKDGTVIFNADDQYLSKIKHMDIPQKRIGYSIKAPSHYQADKIKRDKGFCRFSVNRKRFEIRYLSDHQIYNALCGICCGELLKVSYNDIKINIKRTPPSKGRLAMTSVGGVKMIDDTYNANPISFQVAVSSLISVPTRGRRFVVCADMKELGKRSKFFHQQAGREISSMPVDEVLALGSETKVLIKEVQQKNPQINARHFQKRPALHAFLKKTLRKGDVILVKGSRSMEMEKTVDYLSETLV